VKLTIERLPESRVQFEIIAEDEETSAAMKRAVRTVGNQITVPGFRKGKAPRVMIEQLYGPNVFTEEANQILMTDLYRKALEEEDFTPVGDPEKVDIASTDPFTFTVIVPVFPEVDPGNYREVRIDPIDAAVDDAAVDELVETLRKAHSPWVDPQSEGLQVGADLALTPKSRQPRDGDQVTIDYTVQQEGENAEEPVTDAVFVLGESGLLEPIEDAIRGLRVGESTGFSVPFAEDDETVDASLRGKTLSYTVTLKGVKERDLLPLDDDFAKTVGDVDTMDELRRNIREDIHQARTRNARADVLSQTIAKMAEGATIDLPEPMVDRAVEDDVRSLRGRLSQQGASLEAYIRTLETTEDDLRAELRPAASERLRNSLLLRSIAEKEEVAVAGDELDGAVERLALAAQQAGQGERAAAFAHSERIRGMLESELFERQLADRLIDIATEGRGAVINPWTPPVAEATEETPAGDVSTAESNSAEGGESTEQA
jgi:trigger factor